eukprot:scaffold41920_cov52-Phaeocystis_antarctica.AAC.2
MRLSALDAVLPLDPPSHRYRLRLLPLLQRQRRQCRSRAHARHGAREPASGVARRLDARVDHVAASLVPLLEHDAPGAKGPAPGPSVLGPAPCLCLPRTSSSTTNASRLSTSCRNQLTNDHDDRAVSPSQALRCSFSAHSIQAACVRSSPCGMRNPKESSSIEAAGAGRLLRSGSSDARLACSVARRCRSLKRREHSNARPAGGLQAREGIASKRRGKAADNRGPIVKVLVGSPPPPACAPATTASADS